MIVGMQSPCAETGDQIRTERACAGGVAADREVSAVCTRETDGVVLAPGEFGDCRYAGPCAETGDQVRTERACVGGVVADREVSAVCTRDRRGCSSAG